MSQTADRINGEIEKAIVKLNKAKERVSILRKDLKDLDALREKLIQLDLFEGKDEKKSNEPEKE